MANGKAKYRDLLNKRPSPSTAANLEAFRDQYGTLSSVTVESAPITEPIKYIHYSKLQENNFQKQVYPDYRDIDALARVIAAKGIHTPLEIYPTGQGDTYYILSGHRRWHAFCTAVSKYEYHGAHGNDCLPCIVLPPPKPGEQDRMEELLLLANLQREKNDYERVNEVYNYWRIINDRKKRGEYRGVVREEVIRNLGVSDSMITRSQKIKEDLIPELMDLFRRETFGTRIASELAKLDRDVQQGIYVEWTKCKASCAAEDADEQKSLTQQKIVELTQKYFAAKQGGIEQEPVTGVESKPEAHIEETPARKKATSSVTRMAAIGPITRCTGVKDGADAIYREADSIKAALNTSKVAIDRGIEKKLVRRIDKILALQAELKYELKLLGLLADASDAPGVDE